MAYHEHCILVQQKLDIIVAFTNSVLHSSVQSEFMFQTSKLMSLDISVVCLCPCSYFSLMKRCSWVWWLGSHTHLTSWGGQVMLCFYPYPQRIVQAAKGSRRR